MDGIMNFLLFQAKIKIQDEFTSELTNKSSVKYQSLKSNIESGLKTSLKKIQPAIEHVDVTGFRAGSVIADYHIIVIDANAAENITTAKMQSAVETAVTTSNFTGIAVNTTFLPQVQCKYGIILMIHYGIKLHIIINLQKHI